MRHAYTPPTKISLSIDVARHSDEGDGVRFEAYAFGFSSSKKKSLGEALNSWAEALYKRRSKLAGVRSADLSDAAREELRTLFEVLGTISTADECSEAKDE